MLISLLHVLRWIALAAMAGNIAFCLIATFACLGFAQRKRGPVPSADLPPVSILKPLKGNDPGMYAALRSHCIQDYPEYEILFGVTDLDDPAVPIVKRLIHEFPALSIRLVFCEKRLGANGKVSSLIQLAQVTKAEYLLVNDSDIRVEPNYLQTVISELQQSNAGMVTCLYRGIPGESLGSRLEALGISTDFVPGVLAANLLEGGLHFGLGSTLAFRKSDLNMIGGFEAIVDYLADDYELGSRIAKLGRRIELSRVIVETNLPVYDFAGFWAHQLRWARTIRASRPGGYLGLLLTFTAPWVIAATVFLWPSHSWAWILVAGAAVSRMACMSTSLWVLGESYSLWGNYVIGLRELLAPMVWLAGWFGNSIVWRGERFTLKDGKLTRK